MIGFWEKNTSTLASLCKLLFLVPVKGGRWHIITQLAVYTTYIPHIYLYYIYILPFGGSYATYHILWEPETTMSFGYFFVAKKLFLGVGNSPRSSCLMNLMAGSFVSSREVCIVWEPKPHTWKVWQTRMNRQHNVGGFQCLHDITEMGTQDALNVKLMVLKIFMAG